jgi:hypothetical protein
MKKLMIALCLIAVVTGCSSSDNSETNTGKGYDRTAMLTNWSDNIIIPAYENYTAKVNTLSQSATAFSASPDATTLAALRTEWLNAYTAYQYVAMYDLGKAAELYLKQSANTYPTDVAGIQANITSGTYNLNLQAQFSKQGFPAIDYLINGQGTDAETITFLSNANASAYLTAVINRLKTIATAAEADWKGNYRAEYISNNGTSVTSSVNKTTNNFIKNLEKDIRTAKLGIPAGLFSNGTTYADKVEAYYKNNVSRTLLNTGIQAEIDFFNGKAFSSSATGASLKSALNDVTAIREGQNLSDVINNQFTTILTTNNTLNESFSTQVTNDNAKMVTAYNTLQQGVIYLKVDMMQALNMTIDYVDGDGD